MTSCAGYGFVYEDLSLEAVPGALRGFARSYREALGALDPGVQVLFMSGYPEEQIRARGVLAKKLAFISKPLAPAELLSRVRGILDGQC